MDEFCEYIKDQREDIDLKVREQINKQKIAFRKKRAETRMFSKIKTMSKLFSEEQVTQEDEVLSDIKEDEDDLEDMGVHHVNGRVVAIDHELIKDKTRKLNRKQTIMAAYKKKVQFSKTNSKMSDGKSPDGLMLKNRTPRISPAGSPQFTPIGSPKQTPRPSPNRRLELKVKITTESSDDGYTEFSVSHPTEEDEPHTTSLHNESRDNFIKIEMKSQQFRNTVGNS